MRDRDQRLRWIEKLIGGAQQGEPKKNALVIPTNKGSLALAFSTIEELIGSDGVKSIAFLPDEFCGVVHHGNELAPVIDVGGKDGDPDHVVLLRGADNLLGLKFRGTPYVVELGEAEYSVADILFERKPERKALPLLDTDAAIEKMLAQTDGLATNV